LISFFSYKTYKLADEKKYLYFSLGFIFLGTGLILHAIGNLSFYFGIERCMNMQCNLSQQTLFFAHMLHVILMFFAYNILILIYFKVKEKSLVVLAFVEAFMLAMLTFSSYLFDLAGFIFMLFIIYGAYRNYGKNKTRNTLLPLIAFSLIGISHILSIWAYIIPSYLCLFFGYLSFLLIFSKNKRKAK